MLYEQVRISDEVHSLNLYVQQSNVSEVVCTEDRIKYEANRRLVSLLKKCARYRYIILVRIAKEMPGTGILLVSTSGLISCCADEFCSGATFIWVGIAA